MTLSPTPPMHCSCCLRSRSCRAAGRSSFPASRGLSAECARKAKFILSPTLVLIAITLVKSAGDFLTRISMPAFCPVPSSIPKGYATALPASTGPYYVSSVQGDRTVLLRNPNYRGSRPRRAARIVYTNDVATPTAVSLANTGAIDLLPQDFDNTTSFFDPAGVLAHRSGAGSAAARAGRQQYFLYPAPLLDYIVFNTNRRLFRDVRLRRGGRPGLIGWTRTRERVACASAVPPAWSKTEHYAHWICSR